jgi:hypothetical protein
VLLPLQHTVAFACDMQGAACDDGRVR